jgi:hypothetical protein
VIGWGVIRNQTSVSYFIYILTQETHICKNSECASLLRRRKAMICRAEIAETRLAASLFTE